MKKLILSVTAMAACSVGAYAQGTINIDNFANTGSGSTYQAQANNGLIYTADVANQAGTLGYASAGNTEMGNYFNFALYGNGTSQSASSLAVAGNLMLSLTGAATSVGNSDNPAIGQLSDIAGSVYDVPGTTGAGTAYFDLFVWEGSDTTYAAAVADGSYAGTTGVFANPTGGGLTAPTDLTGMPNINLVTTTVVPEPSTLAMAGVGLASMLIFRRRNK